MAKKHSHMKLTIETVDSSEVGPGKHGIDISGDGYMGDMEYFMFLLKSVSGICDLVEKQIPDMHDAFLGGMSLMIRDKALFEKVSGLCGSILFDGSNKR